MLWNDLYRIKRYINKSDFNVRLRRKISHSGIVSSMLHLSFHQESDFGVRVCSSRASKQLRSWIQMIHSLWMERSALEATLATRPALRVLQTSHKEAVSNHWCTWKQLAARQTADSGKEREWEHARTPLEPREGLKKTKNKGVTWWSLESTVRKPNRNRLHSLTGKECSPYRKWNRIFFVSLIWTKAATS